MTLPEPNASRGRKSGARSGVRLAVAAALGASAMAGLVLTAAPAAANPPMPHDPIGALEHVTALKGGQLRLQGWAADPDSKANTVVHALLDGRKVAVTTTSVSRPGVTKKHHTGPTPGYDFLVSAPKRGVHTLCTVVRNIGSGLSRLLGCRVTPLGTSLTSTQVSAHSPSGVVSSATATSSTMEFTGWANEPDYHDGRIVTVLYVDGSPAKTVDSHRATADQQRAGAGPRGAYDITVPVSRGAHIGCIWVVNTGYGYNRLLGCKAADTRGPAGTGDVATPKINKAVVKEAKRHIGEDYVWGAEGPHKFDCSGLVMYSYHKAGYTTPRVSQDQFHAARVIPASRAVPGDLVFYHDSEGSVYHVGIYLSPGHTVAAIDTAEGVNYQSIDTGSATYGSFTHT
jgi:cell wall-associated NlpC family hydrolase